MFCDRMDVEKSWRVPPFSFFRHCEIFSRKWKFLFSSIFSCFATEWMLKNLKGSTLSVFRQCETLARQSVHFFEYVIFSKKFFSKKLRFSSTVKEYLTLGSLFAIFELWIWRRLGPVPACLQYFCQLEFPKSFSRKNVLPRARFRRDIWSFCWKSISKWTWNAWSFRIFILDLFSHFCSFQDSLQRRKFNKEAVCYPVGCFKKSDIYNWCTTKKLESLFFTTFSQFPSIFLTFWDNRTPADFKHDANLCLKKASKWHRKSNVSTFWSLLHFFVFERQWLPQVIGHDF